MITYTYTKIVNHDALGFNISLNNLPAPIGMHSINDQFSITYDPDLSSADKLILDGIVAVHDYTVDDYNEIAKPLTLIDRWIHWNGNTYGKSTIGYTIVTTGSFIPLYDGLYSCEATFEYDGGGAQGLNTHLFYTTGTPIETFEISETIALVNSGSMIHKRLIELSAGSEYTFSMEYASVKNGTAVSVEKIMFELSFYSSHI